MPDSLTVKQASSGLIGKSGFRAGPAFSLGVPDFAVSEEARQRAAPRLFWRDLVSAMTSQITKIPWLEAAVQPEKLVERALLDHVICSCRYWSRIQRGNRDSPTMSPGKSRYPAARPRLPSFDLEPTSARADIGPKFCYACSTSLSIGVSREQRECRTAIGGNSGGGCRGLLPFNRDRRRRNGGATKSAQKDAFRPQSH